MDIVDKLNNYAAGIRVDDADELAAEAAAAVIEELREIRALLEPRGWEAAARDTRRARSESSSGATTRGGDRDRAGTRGG